MKEKKEGRGNVTCQLLDVIKYFILSECLRWRTRRCRSGHPQNLRTNPQPWFVKRTSSNVFTTV